MLLRTAATSNSPCHSHVSSSGSTVLLVVLAILNALLGMALGRFVSAFATSEFQAVQFMPAVVLPQLLLCGLFAPATRWPGGWR